MVLTHTTFHIRPVQVMKSHVTIGSSRVSYLKNTHDISQILSPHVSYIYISIFLSVKFYILISENLLLKG